MNRLTRAVLNTALLAGAAVVGAGTVSKNTPVATLLATFEPNRGQLAPEFDYLAKGFGYAVEIASTHADVALVTDPSHASRKLSLQLLGADPHSPSEALERGRPTASYFFGNRSLTGIPTFGKIRYSHIWPGIDIVYYGTSKQLEYDFAVAPGADPGTIHFRFGGVREVRSLAGGSLLLRLESGDDLVQQIPVAYQIHGDTRVPVDVHYRRDGQDSIRLELGRYDRSQPLVIDPILLYSLTDASLAPAYGTLSANATASDASGNSYYVGTTPSVPVSQSVSHYTVYLAQVDNGGTLLNSISLAAVDGDSFGTGIALDSTGNIYVTGYTTSPADFFHQNGYQVASGGGQDAFLTKLDPTLAQVLYSTYLGGSGSDQGNSVAVNEIGIAYVAGQTSSPNFPVVSPPAGQNGFIVAIDTTKSGLSSLVYALALGGSGTDAALGVAVDANSNAYVAGSTTSSDFQPTSATGYATSKSNANDDGFLVVLNHLGSTVWATFFPSGPINAVAQTGARYAYVAGQTTGVIAAAGSPYQSGVGAGHAFFAKFDTTQNGAPALTYSTDLTAVSGGQDSALGIATDSLGRAYITGWTTASAFPLVGSPQIQASFIGAQDGFLATINPTQSGSAGLTYSTFLGPSGNTAGTGVAVDLYDQPSVAATSYAGVNNINADGGLTFKLGSQIWGTSFYVTQLYLDLLNRTPDQAGLAYWTGQLNSKQQTRASLAAQFFTSAEFSEGGLSIIEYYIAVLGRDPDYAGWHNWFNQWVGGVPLTTILNDFLSSPEFQNTYGTLSNKAFVDLVYENVLGRPADQAGENYWVGLLNNNQVTKEDVMASFIASSEFSTTVRPRAYANLLYMGFLRRTADPTGLQFWINSLASPSSLPGVINSFITSPEYVARFN